MNEEENAKGDAVYSALRWKLYLNICISTFYARVLGTGKCSSGRARWGTGLKTGDIFQMITQCWQTMVM